MRVNTSNSYIIESFIFFNSYQNARVGKLGHLCVWGILGGKAWERVWFSWYIFLRGVLGKVNRAVKGPGCVRDSVDLV